MWIDDDDDDPNAQWDTDEIDRILTQRVFPACSIGIVVILAAPHVGRWLWSFLQYAVPR